MKTEIIKLRVTPDEKAAFQAAAELSGVAMSAWIRERLRRVAVRDLVEAGRQVPFLQTKSKE